MGICAVVLAAGEGRRLRPLTDTTPKALCPVGNVALLDRALSRLARHRLSGPALVAVNAWYLAAEVAGFVGGRAFVSVEPGPEAYGTAGALAHLRDWIGGRAVLVGNADAYLSPRAGAPADLSPLFDGWNGETVRLLAVDARPGEAGEFSGLRFAGYSLIPGPVAAGLALTRSELVHKVWRPAEAAGRLEIIRYDGTYLDTGTPADYLAANLHAAGEKSIVAPDAVLDSGAIDQSVVGAGAVVLGRLTRTVVWPGGRVDPDEHLVDCVRVGRDLTVQVGLSS
jgi:MurNAc alpha-1-phosphate uridylyltransferase